MFNTYLTREENIRRLYEDGSAEYPKQAPVGKGIGEEVCK
jgi:hypothetical protein